jgi:hypothetical protein
MHVATALTVKSVSVATRILISSIVLVIFIILLFISLFCLTCPLHDMSPPSGLLVLLASGTVVAGASAGTGPVAKAGASDGTGPSILLWCFHSLLILASPLSG